MLRINNKNQGELLLSKEEKNIYYALIVLLFITFIFSNQIRIAILGNKLGNTNYACLVILIFLFIKSSNIFNLKYVLFVIIINAYFLYSTLLVKNHPTNIIGGIISFTIPLMIIFITIEEKIFTKFFDTLIFSLNTIILIITTIGVADYILNGKIMVFIGGFMTARINELIQTQYNFNLVYRMYSFMGHPLFNNQLYLMFYTLNVSYNKYINKKIPNIIILAITVLGTALSGSKTGIVLLILSVLFFNSKKSTIPYYCFLIIVFFIGFKLGIFDNVLSRFTSESLTTGRSQIWEIVKSYNLYPIKIFTGYGIGFVFYYNTIINFASAAFEYPFRMFALELGSFITLMIYFCLAVYPIYILFRRKHVSLVIAYLIMFIDVNTYNGLSLIGDYMLIFCIYIFTLLNLSNYLLNRKYTDIS